MCNLLGLPLDLAENELKKNNIAYKIIKYNSRFKDDIKTDSFRVVRQRQLNDDSIELVVSDFKTKTQSR